jgi:hypothetical protein
MLNMGQDINELQKTTIETTSLVEQYFETNNLSENPIKTCNSLCQTNQCR